MEGTKEPTELLANSQAMIHVVVIALETTSESCPDSIKRIVH